MFNVKKVVGIGTMPDEWVYRCGFISLPIVIFGLLANIMLIIGEGAKVFNILTAVVLFTIITVVTIGMFRLEAKIKESNNAQ